ncbi:MAG: hypothetical protein AABY15_03745, partial [Nanoarchaeota archaeon]
MNYGIILVLFLIFSLVPSAYAFPGFENWTIFQDWRNFSQNFVEIITIDPQQKQEILLKNMAEWQSEKETMIKEGKSVPKQYDEIIAKKQDAIQRTETNQNHVLSDIVDTVLVGQELGSIRSYVAEFHKLKTDDIPSTEKSERITVLERNVNQLNLVKKHCSPVSVNVLLSVQDPYDSLITDYCKVLKNIPRPVVMSA